MRVFSEGPRWQGREETFGAALTTAAVRRFTAHTPNGADVQNFVRSLHLEDLALACACRDGVEIAWEHLVREYRPALQADARSIAGVDGSDLVEPLFAELYGLPNSQGVRSPLLAHYHGRARLGTWLRSVLAQDAQSKRVERA